MNTDQSYAYEMSTDGGASWTPTDPPPGFPSIDAIKRAHEWPVRS